MIGMIALAGIIVRNSILLVDFIQLAEERGRTLREAVLEAGAVRFRPIALTAAAVVVGGLVMVLDPIFQGLAVALMSGAVVATLLTMVVVPLLYWELRRRETPERAPPPVTESQSPPPTPRLAYVLTTVSFAASPARSYSPRSRWAGGCIRPGCSSRRFVGREPAAVELHRFLPARADPRPLRSGRLRAPGVTGAVSLRKPAVDASIESAALRLSHMRSHSWNTR